MKKETFRYVAAITGGFALGLAGCKAMGIAPFAPTSESSKVNSHEFTPTPELDMYPAKFTWLDGRDEVMQKVMTEYGLAANDIKGFGINIEGLLSATGTRTEKVQFLNFIDPATGLDISTYYDSKNPNGLLNVYKTVNRGGGIFVERQLFDINNPENRLTLLSIPANAEEDLKLGKPVTIQFNPPQWIRSYMPGLDPEKFLVVNVPLIPDLSTTSSVGFIPNFINIDGSVEGVQTATPTESSVSIEITDAQKFFGDGFEITPEGNVIDKTLGKEIQGFTIVPFNEQTMIAPYKKEVTWGWQRVYEFDGNPNFTVEGTEADIIVTEDGGLDMYAWGYKDGEFKRQNVEFAAQNGGTIEIEGYSPQEVQQMIIKNSSDDADYRIHSTEALRQMAIKYIPKTVIDRISYTTYKKMLEPQDRTFYYQGNNFIPIPNPDGTWSAVNTTEFMIYSEFKNRSKALVVWIGKDGNPVTVVMETKYAEMPQYFNPYWKNHDINDPFNP